MPGAGAEPAECRVANAEGVCPEREPTGEALLSKRNAGGRDQRVSTRMSYSLITMLLMGVMFLNL